ncbi:MAG: hypothetical protein V2A58_13380 [Planctomycetota bacterium]
MAKTQSKGKCSFCGSTFTNAGMARHVGPCREKMLSKGTAGPKASFYHVAVKGRYLPEYWMHLELRADATLGDLDAFLRETWLECCGHLSAFSIGDTQYMPTDDTELDAENMDIPLNQVLQPGMSFRHEYDFGTTTELSLKVISQWEGARTRAAVRVLARNDPPVIACQACGKPATQVCAECVYAGEGWLCGECAKNHDCGEEMLLPVVNSPRVGMCGYTGD